MGDDIALSQIVANLPLIFFEKEDNKKGIEEEGAAVVNDLDTGLGLIQDQDY